MEDASRGRLSYRPGPPGPTPPQEPRPVRATGRYRMETAGSHALVQAPAGDEPVRLVVLLHGAGGVPEHTIALLEPYVEEHRLLLVAPKSSAPTWDVVTGGPGPDVRAVDELLSRLGATYPVRARTVSGFSDGASCALTLGVANGDVFDSVVAFSPGFSAAEVRHGRPRFFLSHGDADRVLPVARCSRRLVPLLRSEGYEVTYEEFAGGHDVPLDVRDHAVDWLARGDGDVRPSP